MQTNALLHAETLTHTHTHTHARTHVTTMYKFQFLPITLLNKLPEINYLLNVKFITIVYNHTWARAGTHTHTHTNAHRCVSACVCTRTRMRSSSICPYVCLSVLAPRLKTGRILQLLYWTGYQGQRICYVISSQNIRVSEWWATCWWRHTCKRHILQQ